MEEHVRKLDAEYGFNLTEEEIKLVARQAEEAKKLFQPLFEVDLIHVMPILKFDRKPLARTRKQRGPRNERG
jgi:hypothetical protein